MILFKTYYLAPHDRVIVVGKSGFETVLDGSKKARFTVRNTVHAMYWDTVKSLSVDWEDVQEVVRFRRKEAEKHWQIIDVPQGQVALVRHEYLPPAVLAGGKSHAFWRPESGQIEVHLMPADAYRLPESWEKALLEMNELQAPLRRIVVNPNEKMLVMQNGALVDIAASGCYVLHVDERQTKLIFPKTDDRCFAHEQLPLWAQQQPELIGRFLEPVEAGKDELVLCSYDGALHHIVSPLTRRYFWRNERDPLVVQRVPLRQGQARIDGATVQALCAAKLWNHQSYQNLIQVVDVPDNFEAVLRFADGQTQIFSAGLYYFWVTHSKIRADLVDKRRQVCEVSGQELLSADKITLRINAVCHYRVSDSLIWVNQYKAAEDFLYKELQMALRAVIGGKNIDTVLQEKQQIDAELVQLMQEKSLPGITIDTLGIKDIILPGEVRSILAQVVQAEKTAQANNIRRREETAATRSLLNTARVMEDNPTALRLKELETLEKVTEKIDKISVFGGLDGVLNGLININR